jgi:hypothetical protein
MEFKDSDYRVWFDAAAATVFFEGSLRLATADYKPLSDMLDAVTARKPPSLTLNLRDLHFMNSSGINTLYKFVVNLRKAASTRLIVRGDSSIGWQVKSLPNIKRFLPTADVSL